MLERIKEEPALVAGVVQALILLFTAFGLDLTPEQIAAVNAVTVAVLALIVRQKVVPQRKL